MWYRYAKEALASEGNAPSIHAQYLNQKPEPYPSNHPDWSRTSHAFRVAPHKLTLDEFARSPGVVWHGTPWGDFGQGENPLVHVGTWDAAHEALAARIAGQHTEGDIPEVTPEHKPRRTFRDKRGMVWYLADGAEPHPAWREIPDPNVNTIPSGLRPVMIPLKIVGPMGSGVRHDFAGERRPGEVSPESMLKGQIKRGLKPKQGYYYTNEAEGTTTDPNGNIIYSVSAVVPHRSWLRTHEDLVREALEQDENIPPHVLEAYPHLRR